MCLDEVSSHGHLDRLGRHSNATARLRDLNSRWLFGRAKETSHYFRGAPFAPKAAPEERARQCSLNLGHKSRAPPFALRSLLYDLERGRVGAPARTKPEGNYCAGELAFVVLPLRSNESRPPHRSAARRNKVFVRRNFLIYIHAARSERFFPHYAMQISA